jgi:glycosyltransferase involved in cell wall biosynthesis
MKVLMISDGGTSSGTFNLQGIAKHSKHETRLRHFNANEKQGDLDWADVYYIHYGGIGHFHLLLEQLRLRRDKPWIIGVRGFGNFKRTFAGRRGRGHMIKNATPANALYEPVWYAQLCVAYSVSSLQLQRIVSQWTKMPVYLAQAGVDTERFKPSPPPDEFCIGWAGDPYSGPKAYHRLEEFPFPLKTAGTKPKQLFPNQLSAQGWTPHSKMHEFYKDISVYVQVSFSEGCPMPPMEAAASGRPVVGTKVGALMTWLPEKYQVENYKELIPLIEELRDNPKVYKNEMNRFRRISLNWDFSKIVLQYDNMWEDVYNHREELMKRVQDN